MSATTDGGSSGTWKSKVADLGVPAAVAGHKKRRWWVVSVLAAVASLLWLSPALVAHSPLLPWLVDVATGQASGSVSVRSASLAWLSPPVVEGIEVRDPQGQPVLAIPRAAANRSLFSLAWNWTDLGTVRVERPSLDLVLREDGSNLEDILAGLLTRELSDTEPADKKATRVGVRLEIVDGTASVTHPRTQKTWQIDQFQAALDVPAGAGRPLDLKVSGVVVDSRRPGRFAAALKTQPAGSTPLAGDGEVAFEVENLPLEMFAPLIVRFAPGGVTKTAGWLSASVQGRAHTDAKSTLEALSVEGTATIDDLEVAAASLLHADDRLALRRAEAACRIAYQGGRLKIDRLAARTDVGTVSLAGTLDVTDRSTRDLLTWLPRQTLETEGQVDLARLAALLPGTLHIRRETRITSGQIQWSLAGRPESDRAVWAGRLQASNLTAVNGDRRLAWQEPILVTLAVSQGLGDEGPRLESLKCESDFLKLDGSGTLDKMTAQATFNLNRLTAQVGQFVDLGGLRLAGDGRAAVAWNRAADHRFQTQGELQLNDFQFASNDRRPWAEPKWTATFSATGQTDFTSDHRVDTAILEISAGDALGDVVKAQLTRPVSEFARGGAWPVEVHARGPLARWTPRLSPWVDLSAWQLAGRYELMAQATGSADAVNGTLQAVVDDLAVAREGSRGFQQKQVRLSGRGAYNVATRLVQLEEVALSSSAVAATAAGRVDGSGEPAQMEIQGRIDYDLEQWSALARSYLGEGIYLAGRGPGAVSLRGPFAMNAAQGGVKMSWSWGDLYGFQLAPGELQARLAGGAIQIGPADLNVSEGRVRAAAQVRLFPQPAELTVPPGPVVEDVRINPRMCAHGLQFIAPVLAGVATAEGRFSIELSGCRIPLADPSSGEVTGRMTIHSAEIGPGPLVRELALTLGYTSPAQFAKESMIDFRMADGRVYHQGAVVQFPDLTIRTHGWVGLDKSLEIMAEMPVPPKWLGTNRTVNAALRNETIRLPIGGTLQRPKIDSKALRGLGQKAIEKTATKVIEDQLIQGLDRLLKPR